MITFGDMNVDIPSNKKLSPVITELFIRSRKLKVSFLFIIQSYFSIPKNIRLNSTHYFVTKNRSGCIA